MTVAGEGQSPGRPHMLKLAEQAGISHRDAAAIIEEAQAAAVHWTDFAAEAGVSKDTARQIAQSLPGID